MSEYNPQKNSGNYDVPSEVLQYIISGFVQA